MRRAMKYGIAVLTISLLLGSGPPVLAQGAAGPVKGGNGCTIVRKVTVFSVRDPGPATTNPDTSLASLERLEGGQWLPLASTPIDAAGNFEFVGLTPGAYRVCAAGEQGACFAGNATSPLGMTGRAAAPLSAACAASDVQIALQFTPSAMKGNCRGCGSGKSAASGTNNAR